MKKFILFIVVVLLFSSCAESTSIKECVVNEPYGFWSGLWHGFIAPLSFIISLLNSVVAMYALNNNGGWYDFGFLS